MVMLRRLRIPSAIATTCLVAGALASGCGGSESGDGAEAGGTSATSGGASATGGSDAGGPAGTGGNASVCLDFATPIKIGEIESDELSGGPSGIVASRAHAGVLYAELDLGAPPVIFAMTSAGAALGSYALSGAKSTDWEDLAIGPGPGGDTYLYIADIGDNAARTGGTPRSEIQVYRVKEPDISLTQAPSERTLDGVETLRFVYPDAAHDAETLAIDPVSGDLLIVSKEEDGTAVVFRAPGNTAAEMPTELEQVVEIELGMAGEDGQASAGDISPNGDRFLVRTYTKILIWPRAATHAATFSATPHSQLWDTEPQGEGVSFSADGSAWVSMGERSSAIYESKESCP